VTEKSQAVYGNLVPARVQRQASRKKAAYLRKFGDDAGRFRGLTATDIPVLGPLGVKRLDVARSGSDSLVSSEAIFDVRSDPHALVIGTIRMGFGHYRISLAIASAARARGLTPYWFDLHSFQETTGGKIIAELNGLYSMGSRLSQRSALFNRLYWEPLNSEGFRKLTYNAGDQAIAELLAGPCRLLPSDVPFVATHAWPAQAACHAGLTRVVNVIPDNWPMALHLAEGAVHCVQSPSAWFGYRTLRGMDGGRIPKPMPAGSLRLTGHYIDHEIVANLEADTASRLDRLAAGAPLRVLLTVGGAGAQRALYAEIIRSLLPRVRSGKVALFVNVGDHEAVLEGLLADVGELRSATVYRDEWDATRAFAEGALTSPVTGAYLFCHRDIFAAVYATNLLLRSSDLLVTKPSELAFYPVPKLHVRRVGGHEAWGAIRSAELGDGSVECETAEETLAMLNLLLDDGEGLAMMNDAILAAARSGCYSGAYRAVDIALAENPPKEGTR